MSAATSTRTGRRCRTGSKLRTRSTRIPIGPPPASSNSSGEPRPSRTHTRSSGFPGRRIGGDACEAGGLVDAAGASVAGDLRIGAERPRAIDLAVGAVRGNQFVRGGPFLNPLLERADGIELVGPRAAAAVAHPWRGEQ